jgi:CDP-diacylglycerol--glycerol-3-phosphate 3-phosphatidyltransferase
MVIIAREIAVTGLRGLAVEQGVVISASWLGKVKTVLQVAAVFALIIWSPAPLAVDVLVYAAVAMTVISGLDYFFGVRKRIVQERERRALTRSQQEPRATRASSGGGASARPRRSQP